MVNKPTGEVTRVDPSTMDVAATKPGAQPQDAETPPKNPEAPGGAASGGSRMVTSGGTNYLVNLGTGVIEQIDPLTLAVKATHRMSGPLLDAAGDPTGGLWAVASNGAVRRYNGQKQLPSVADLGIRRVSRAGDQMLLLGSEGRLYRYSFGAKAQGVTDLGPAGWDATLAQPTDDPHVTYMLGASGELAVVRPGGEVQGTKVSDPGHQIGSPLIANGHVYVPDYDRRVVVDLNLSTLKVSETTPVPGNGGKFEVFDNGGTVWFNDPTAPNAVVLSPPTFKPRTVDKGVGHGVEDPMGILAQRVQGMSGSIRLIAAGNSEALRQDYGSWLHYLRRSRKGIILDPNVELDGDIFSVRLPRRSPVQFCPGRGCLVSGRDLDLVQMALSDEGSSNVG